MRVRRPFAILALATGLAGCAGGSASGGYVRGAASPAPDGGFRSPQVMHGSGVDSVIGRAAAELTGRFGAARIDLAEGDARKLQFISDGCVLDIFLYPLAANSAPVATHVEARQRDGGGATDHGSCIAAVERAARP
jgi:hypothetical protein